VDSGDPSDALAGVDAIEADRLVDHMAARLRRFGTRHWRENAGDAGGTAADAVHELVLWCARLDAEIDPERPADVPVDPPRPAYAAALADQLAVVGRDLAIAVGERGDPAIAEEVLTTLRRYARALRIEPKD